MHTPLLSPFWGVSFDKERSPFGYAAFETHPFDTSCYGIIDDTDKAVMVLLPYRHTLVMRYAPELFAECVSASKRLGKPLLVDGIGDIELPITDKNIFVLRYGGYRFLKQANEIIMPVYADDLLERYCGGVLELRKKSEVPSVGFAGWAHLSLKQRLRAIAKELPDRVRSVFDSRYGACKKGVFFREQALMILRASDKVHLNALERPSFSGHRDTMSAGPAKLQQEFMRNIIDSDYALDVRGDANASTRLFEILSLGRIPVIIDTERNFPFSDKVDYSAFSLRVDFRDLPRLPDIIADFHAQLSQEKFEAMQRAARKAFVDYFRTDAIMSHVVTELCEKLSLYRGS